MIHHPIILCGKLVLLLVILIVLIILHGILPPEEFRIAVFVAGGVFLVGVIAFWIFAFKVLGNPNSRLGKHMVLSHEARSEDGYVSSTDDFQDMVGRCGSTQTALRPAGIARFGDKRISVITEGEFIPKGSEVEIVSAKGSRVVVRNSGSLNKESSSENAGET
jgi:membrane-bound serine protease (ClpP class)